MDRWNGEVGCLGDDACLAVLRDYLSDINDTPVCFCAEHVPIRLSTAARAKMSVGQNNRRQ